MKNLLVDPHLGISIWTIITFLVLLWLLKKFAWKPLLSALEARRESIRKSLDEAQQARRELEEVNKESARILRNAHVEAESIVVKSRADAERLREELKQKARADADAIVREARRQIETETGRALRQVRSEIADLSIEVASKLIHRNFSKEDNSALIEETLRQLEAGPRPS
jgi:F-type H+-transporting ATPase subunit b